MYACTHMIKNIFYLLVDGASEVGSVGDTGVQHEIGGGVAQTEVMLNNIQ